MSVKIGISPISWQNDDLPDLTAAYTMEQALREGAKASARPPSKAPAPGAEGEVHLGSRGAGLGRLRQRLRRDQHGGLQAGRRRRPGQLADRETEPVGGRQNHGVPGDLHPDAGEQPVLFFGQIGVEVERPGGVLRAGGFEERRDGVRGHLAGDVPRAVSAHPVRDDTELQLRVDAEAVFVRRSSTCVGLTARE